MSMTPLVTLLILLATAVLMVALVAALGAVLRHLKGEEAEPHGSRIAGTLARVTTPIPEDGVGKVAFVRSGQRVSRAAKSSSREALPEGAHVLVVSSEDGAVVVDGLSPEMKEMFR